jgi:hypothetical protein
MSHHGSVAEMRYSGGCRWRNGEKEYFFETAEIKGGY